MAPRAGLTTASVVEAATRIADAEGLESLTLARVAEDLGVKPPSLYEHVAGLRELRQALRLRGLESMAATFRRTATGRARDDAVRALAHAYRRFAREHPALYAVTVESVKGASPRVRAAGDEVLEVLRAVLSGYRIQGEEAVHATRYLRSVLHGFTSLEAAGGFGMPTDLEASFARILEALVLDLRSWSRRAA